LHQQGIIHCDIHPGNIIVQQNCEPVLIDFGSTKLLHPTTWTVTTTVNKDFSPYEQDAESTENTLGPQPAWDIYSLAANMFFAVTGQKPMSAISRKLYSDGLKSPKELKPDLSDQLNLMILQGMALEAEDRPSSVMKWIRLLSVSPEMLSQERRSKPKRINISFMPLRKNQFSPWATIFFLVLGYFLQGLVLRSYVAWDYTAYIAIIAFAWAIAWAIAWNNYAVLAFAFLAFALLGVFVGDLAIIGVVVGIIVGVFLPDMLLITMLFGALLGGGYSAYSTNTGIVWGLCHGLFTWGYFIVVCVGYTTSEKSLKMSFGGIEILLIYGVSSSIGLIAGGILGSWLKVAGILKLP
jgi:Protein kinase domain